MVPKAHFTRQALEAVTAEQTFAIAHIMESPRCKVVDVQLGGFELPEGYLGIRIDYEGGTTPIYGGVAPDGSVST